MSDVNEEYTESHEPLSHADLLEEVVRALVTNQEAVSINEEKISEDHISLSITVAPEECGKIIGKEGATIRALRYLFTCVGAADNHLRIGVRLMSSNGHTKRAQRSHRFRHGQEATS